MPRGNAYNAAYLEYQDQLMRDLIKMAETEQTSRAERLTKAQAQIDALNSQIAELAGAVDNPDMQRQLAQDQFNADMNIATFKEGQRGEVSVTTGGQSTVSQQQVLPSGVIPEQEVQQIGRREDLQKSWADLQETEDETEFRAKAKALVSNAKQGFKEAKLTYDTSYAQEQAFANISQMLAIGEQKGLSDSQKRIYAEVVLEDVNRLKTLNAQQMGKIVADANSLARSEGMTGAGGPVDADKTSTTTSEYTKVSRKLGPDTPAPEYAAPDITTPEMEAELAALRGQRAGLEDEIERLMAGRHPDVMARAQSMFQQYAPIYQEKSRRARQLAGEFADAQMMRKTGLRPEQLLEGTALEGIDPSLFSKIDMSELPQSTRRLAQQVQTAQQRISALNDLESQRDTGRVAIDRYVAARARGAAEQRERTMPAATPPPGFVAEEPEN